MKERQVEMGMSQEFMRAAMDYYLRHVVFASDLKIKDVQVDGPDRKINQTDHFKVVLCFPDESPPGEAA